MLEQIMGKGLGTRPQKRPHHNISGWFKKFLIRVGLSSYWGGKTSWRCCVRRLTRCSCGQFSNMCSSSWTVCQSQCHRSWAHKVKVKVTSLYMPQRASQRKLGKSLQPNLSKQKGKCLTPPPQEEWKRSTKVKRVAGLAWNWLLMKAYNGTGKVERARLVWRTFAA